jgi:hypothetical protein
MRVMALARWLMPLVLVLGGCATLPSDVLREMAATAPGERDPFALVSPAPVAQAVAVPGARPPAPHELRTGQLLVWANAGAVGLFVNLFAETFSPWTHIGVVSVESDGVFVYDSNADLQVSADGPATISGPNGVQRTLYRHFLDSDRMYGLFDPPPGVDTAALLAFVQEQRRRGTPFDARYDSRDPDALYCSELVALGLAGAGGVAPAPVPVRRNRSYDRLRAWLDLSSHGFVLPGQLVAHTQPVAVWSRGLNRAQIEATFAAREALARRFDADARLGLLMRWNETALSLTGALSLREGPQRLIDAAQAATADMPDEAAQASTIRRTVDALAGRLLGPVR